jgi:hypothetical protein
VCSLDSLNDHNIVRLFGRSLEKDICPSIDEETILSCVSSSPRVSDTIGLVARLSEFSICRKAVFQVAAYRPRLDGKLDRLIDRIHGIAIAAFQVDRHREVRCSDDPAEIVDHQGKWDTLAIGEAVGIRDRPTTRRDRLRSGGCDGPRAARIPDIKKDKRPSGDMESPELFSFARLISHSLLLEG